jgi:hypothetical protein
MGRGARPDARAKIEILASTFIKTRPMCNYLTILDESEEKDVYFAYTLAASHPIGGAKISSRLKKRMEEPSYETYL